MKRLLLLVFLLILWTFPLSSLPSTPGVNEWPLCFSESEFQALEDQVWAETERTVREAVEAAVAPYRAVVKRQEGTILWLKVGIGVSLGTAVGLGLWAVLK